MSETETVQTAVETPASPDLASLSKPELAKWRETGDLPAPKTSDSSDADADSSTAQPDGQAVSTETSPSPASEPGTPKKKANAETRIKELLDQVKAKDAELASLRTRPTPEKADVTAKSSPATEPVTIDSVMASPDLSQPMLDETAFYTQFPDATVGQYVRYVSRYELLSDAAQREQTQTLQQREREFAERAAKVPTEVYQKLPPELLNAKPVDLMSPGEARTVWNVAIHEILTSSDPARLLTHLVNSPEAMEAIRATQNEAATIRTIAQIEARLDGPSVPSKPVVKTTSSAPPPPPTLGSKPSSPSDEIEDALATGDFKKYKRLMNAKEMTGQL